MNSLGISEENYRGISDSISRYRIILKKINRNLIEDFIFNVDNVKIRINFLSSIIAFLSRLVSNN